MEKRELKKVKNPIDSVRERKKNNVLVYDDINFGNVIAMQTYYPTFKNTIKEIVRLFCFDYLLFSSGDETSENMIVYSLANNNRKDYDEILKNFENCLTDYYRFDLKKAFGLRKVFKKLKLFFNIFVDNLIKNIENPFFIAVVLAQYFIIKDNFTKQYSFVNVKKLISFCDSYGPENLIVQLLMRNNNITTFTLQHGQYRFLNKGNETPDSEVYENFISDYLLAWGQATVDEFKKSGIDENRFIITGAFKSFSNNLWEPNTKIKNVFGVVLCGETYRESNIKMIELCNHFAEKNGYRYYLRVHPKNPIDFYKSMCNDKYLISTLKGIENNDYSSLVDFSVVHMTGVFVELLSIGSPVFVYEDEYLEDLFKIKEFCINSESNMRNLYNKLKGNTNEFMTKQKAMYNYYNNTSNCREIEAIINEKSNIKEQSNARCV